MSTVYHGTNATFPPQALSSGPDAPAPSGTPQPGLWLTESAAMAAVYASWAADHRGGGPLRIIELWLHEDCPREHDPNRPEELLVAHPELHYQDHQLRVVRAHRVRRRRVRSGRSRSWHLSIPELDVNLLVPCTDTPHPRRLRPTRGSSNRRP